MSKRGPDSRIKRKPERYRPGYAHLILRVPMTRWHLRGRKRGKYRHIRMH